MTLQDAINQLAAEIKLRGKFNAANVLDGLIGVAKANTDELQQKLNELLTRKGVLTPDDQAQVALLLDKQKQAARERKNIRVKNIVLLTSIFLGTGVVIYFDFKKHKKK